MSAFEKANPLRSLVVLHPASPLVAYQGLFAGAAVLRLGLNALRGGANEDQAVARRLVGLQAVGEHRIRGLRSVKGDVGIRHVTRFKVRPK